MAIYPQANRRAQWFQDSYPGDVIDPNVLVVHTTEGSNWPSYGGGSSAPTLTAKPDYKRKRLVWRQHFDTTRSARALRNESGGVETNTLNAVQVELIGTCNPPSHRKYGWMFWPEAPDWALRDLADFIAWLHEAHPDFPVRDEGKQWPSYPSSYGATSARMSLAEWRNAYGIVGHLHVPENSHGDPGSMDIDRVVKFARRENPGGSSKPDRKPTRVQQARRVLWHAIQYAKKRGFTKRLRRLRKARRTLPKQ